MDGTPDTAGVVFAALIIVLAIPSSVTYLRARRRGELDQERRTTGAIFLVAAILVGAVNVVRAMGRMPNEAAYWTLQFSLTALFCVMFWRFSRAKRGAP
jgi:multisubunit Na+/H+ antiporter MnhB subunit